MNRGMVIRIAAALLVLTQTVFAQHRGDSQTSLQQENSRLRSEVARLQTACSPASSSDAVGGAEQRVGDLDFAVAAVHTGPSTGYATGYMTVAVTMRIRNSGSQPVAINYIQKSFSLVDDHGYEYKLYHENSTTYFAEDIKGISMATTTAAGTDDVVAPGQTLTVTVLPVRYMRNGETVGNRFDIQATFGAYTDIGQGRIRRIRNYSVAFIGLSR